MNGVDIKFTIVLRELTHGSKTIFHDTPGKFEAGTGTA